MYKPVGVKGDVVILQVLENDGLAEAGLNEAEALKEAQIRISSKFWEVFVWCERDLFFLQ